MPKSSYQTVLMEIYLENNKFCNIVELFSEELQDYSMMVSENNPIVGYFIKRLSGINQKFAEDIRNCTVNNNGIIERKMKNGELLEKTVLKEFKNKRMLLEDVLTDYIDSNIQKKLIEANIDMSDEDKVQEFAEKTEEGEYESIIKSIHCKYFSILDDRF